MALTEQQAIQIICSYFNNDFNTIVSTLQNDCNIPTYLFELSDTDNNNYHYEQNTDIFLQTLFYKLTNKEKNTIYKFAKHLRKTGNLELNIQTTQENANPKYHSTDNKSITPNQLRSDIDIEIINISTLSELAMYINQDNQEIPSLIIQVESAMMHEDKETYFKLLLELFSKLAEDKIIPPLIPNTLMFIQNNHSE